MVELAAFDADGVRLVTVVNYGQRKENGTEKNDDEEKHRHPFALLSLSLYSNKYSFYLVLDIYKDQKYLIKN